MDSCVETVAAGLFCVYAAGAAAGTAAYTHEDGGAWATQKDAGEGFDDLHGTGAIVMRLAEGF